MFLLYLFLQNHAEHGAENTEYFLVVQWLAPACSFDDADVQWNYVDLLAVTL